jgi:prophage antirepressor-like protein
MNILDKYAGAVSMTTHNLEFNLYKVAEALGYSRPTKAVQDFISRNRGLLHSVLGEDQGIISVESVPEQVLYHFLGESNTEAGKQFRLWVWYTVLPEFRKQQQKQIDLAKCRAYLDENRKTSLEDLCKLFPTDIADEVIASSDKYYRSLGFLPPSDFSTPQRVHEVCMAHGVFDEHGDPTPEWVSDVYLCSRWEGLYNGKWYAFGPKIVALVLAPGRSLLAELDETCLAKGFENFGPVRRKNKSH